MSAGQATVSGPFPLCSWLARETLNLKAWVQVPAGTTTLLNTACMGFCTRREYVTVCCVHPFVVHCMRKTRIFTRHPGTHVYSSDGGSYLSLSLWTTYSQSFCTESTCAQSSISHRLQQLSYPTLCPAYALYHFTACKMSLVSFDQSQPGMHWSSCFCNGCAA